MRKDSRWRKRARHDEQTSKNMEQVRQYRTGTHYNSDKHMKREKEKKTGEYKTDGQRINATEGRITIER